MMKREIGHLSNNDAVDGSRTKRQKQIADQAATDTATGNTENEDAQMDTGEGSSSGAAGLKEQGTKLWQMLKDVVNKEGYICSPAFMRLPSKRHYPDYYVFIQQPICLDDIKQKIDDGLYNSIDDIRQDFDLCFSNAKKYNQKNSRIWLDAKFMLKFVNKEYTKMTGKKVKKNGDGDDDEEKPGDGADGEKKNKQPNLTRLLKARLQKLVDKADDETHRVLSNVFMEMPSKKDYPIYYKQIKRPMCIETIFKHLKRKEYQTSLEFATDVELVFSNALEFNQDHSQIWEDAIILRDYFRQLMSDLPEPYALSQYTKPSAKIKLKVPGAAAAGAPAAGSSTTVTFVSTKPQEKEGAGGGSLTLRLPATGGNAKSPAQSSMSQLPAGAGVPGLTPTAVQGSKPVTAPAPKPATTPQPLVAAASPAQPSTPLPTPAVQAAQTKAAPSPQVTTQPLQYQPTTNKPQYYPNATYHQYTHPAPAPPTPAAAIPSTQPAPQVALTRTSQSVSRSPAPALAGHRPLKGVFLITRPRGRPFWLDHRDGVKSWAMRLGQGEKSISVAEIRFFGDDDETGDEEGDGNDEHPDEEEEEEEPSPKKRGRGRPPKNPKAKAKAAALAKKAEQKKAQNAPTPQGENILINLNGTAMNEKLEEGVWNMDLQVGENVLEVGEKSGHIWKVYLERVSII
ncbi:Bromodomain-containing protein [Suillus paluster]|uniref:Bromodomain-containing protein n=1 Tax=Suillus paluster TaxID=48578 RepID=UPI001B85CD72|nr:Bromodomain-containing protein [Suillus paluster]KAG1754925.1 Bromodomain-containing protein [Suillus paluster]